MKKISFFLIVLFLLVLTHCKFSNNSASNDNIVAPAAVDSTVVISGIVTDLLSSNVVANATVSILDLAYILNTTTASDGSFKFSFKISSTSVLTIRVVAIKEGYVADTQSVTISAGKTLQVSPLRIHQSNVSNDAASIYLLSQTTDRLEIKGSGNMETAVATFQVIDSTGHAISANRAMTVNFQLIQGPGGGEFVSPASIKTDDKGQASVAITTGTKAGVIQILAYINVTGKTIYSKPIFFTIYGGFPVQERFAVASNKLNYPYFGIMNQEILFTALLGDKYSNPVRPNTSVYFYTTEGVIGKIVSTDELGRATATLATLGYPFLPNASLPNNGTGFFKVTAKTITENSDTISTSTVRLLSGLPVIKYVSPTTFNIPNGGSATFTFTVTDINNNPISSDNTISFTTVGGTLVASPASYVIPDALFSGKGITEFTVTIGDSDSQNVKPTSSSLIINVVGPFGTVSYNISGNSE